MDWTAHTAHEIASAYGFMPSVLELDEPRMLDDASTLGDVGLPDFNALISSDPTFAGGWNDIAAQLTAEGTADLTGAKIALAGAYENLISQQFGGLDAPTAIAKAKEYVTVGQTVVGAVSNIASLIQAGNSGANPIDVFQGFTGAMIGLAVATGLSAGIGAAIVGLVSIALPLFNSIVGPPKQVFDSTDPQCVYGPFNIDHSNPPSFGVGCIAAWGPTYTPDSPYWRPFPTPPTLAISQASGGIIPIPSIAIASVADATWFTRGQVGPGAWRGAFYGCVNPSSNQNNTPDKWWSPPGVNPAGTDQNARPIDNAFPAYAQVIEGNGGFGAFDTSSWPADWVSTFHDFVAAFQAAWRANAAYALNGLKPQDDSTVLLHLLRVWNLAHDGPAYSLVDSAPNYIGSLVTKALGQGSQPEVSDGSGHGVKLNLGPMKQPPVVAGTAPTPASSTPATSSGPSAGAVVVTTAATAIAAGSIWWLLGQPMTVAALQAAVEEAVHSAANVVRRL